MVLNSDQEPAMLSLKRAVAVTRRAETCPIESPVRESKATGAMERAIRTWQGQLRALKSCFEQRIGQKLPAEDALLEWLVLWAAEILNCTRIRASGRTT